jgi:hypothetical protein
MSYIDPYEIENYFINLELEFCSYSSELKYNYEFLQILILNYDKRLNNILILSKKINLIDFFLNIEKQIIYLYNIFKTITNNNIKNYIIKQLFSFRKYNITNIKKFL